MKPSSNKTTKKDPKIIIDDLLEEMDWVKAYDATKTENDEIFPFNQELGSLDMVWTGYLTCWPFKNVMLFVSERSGLLGLEKLYNLKI